MVGLPDSLHVHSVGTELVSALTNTWAQRFSPAHVTSLQRTLKWYMAHKGSWWLSMSSITSMLVASQSVHQLVSLCFICKCHFTRAVGHSRPCVLRSYCSSSPVTPPEESSNGPGMQWLSRLTAYGFHRDTLQRETSMLIMGYHFLYPLHPCYGCPWKRNKRQKVNWDRVIMGFMYFFF